MPALPWGGASSRFYAVGFGVHPGAVHVVNRSPALFSPSRPPSRLGFAFEEAASDCLSSTLVPGLATLAVSRARGEDPLARPGQYTPGLLRAFRPGDRSLAWLTRSSISPLTFPLLLVTPGSPGTDRFPAHRYRPISMVRNPCTLRHADRAAPLYRSEQSTTVASVISWRPGCRHLPLEERL